MIVTVVRAALSRAERRRATHEMIRANPMLTPQPSVHITTAVQASVSTAEAISSELDAEITTSDTEDATESKEF